MEAYLKKIEDVIAMGPYKADWESLSKMEKPSWFPKAKFGIFVHWGLYSVAANSNEWYSRNMYIDGYPAFEHHVKTYGPQSKFGYKDFIPMFTAEKFDADAWVELFKEAGAEYLFPVSEHHDGFQMYRSDISHYNAAEMGPKRDVLGELRTAAEKQNMVFCTSNHRAEHWWFMGHGKEFDSDIKEPMQRGDFYWPAMPEPDNEDLYSEPYPSEEFLNDWLIRVCEIIDQYQPALLYFDWWVQHEAFKKHLKKLMAYYYNRSVEWGKNVAICYKHDAIPFGMGIVEVERGGFKDPKPYVWQTDTAVAHNSWCYTDTLDYKTPYDIICMLIDVVSKNGNLLLNVGPKGDGSIPEGDTHILKEIGKWMKVNGEAIKESQTWRKCKEGPTEEVEGQFTDGKKSFTEKDFKFTCKGSSIYAFAMQYPKDGRVCITSLKKSADQNRPEFHGIIRRVSILGFQDDVDFSITEDGLVFTAEDVSSPYPVCIKIEMA
ncbi:MAG: alpha-L-fucosidase [Lachnospiraceae bacterium]|nr:alpha-L-fucosidase [Lachnospiraceae bacterium]